ncbi:DUF1801 domain-containing protein [Caldimonas brevitalea]|uniref:YdhG-like domain-containing protein n=1 Tax=Caldimonas brevitalea TaxID=413882 RepID=A0A0G3BZG1_9BURK|nr:DUF1801 domain-containing protein [Caldimonas brevitalea]AKJ31930.1 hypothetical protein AAW51_5239 [Caldimonas brevitalea]
MGKSVHDLLYDIRQLGEMQFRIIEAVRAVTMETIAPLEEEVKYGGILFTSGVQFGGVFAYKEHVSVEFSQGAKLDDRYGLLEGTGKGRRHLKLRSLSDISAKKLAFYLPLALQAARNCA